MIDPLGLWWGEDGTLWMSGTESDGNWVPENGQSWNAVYLRSSPNPTAGAFSVQCTLGLPNPTARAFSVEAGPGSLGDLGRGVRLVKYAAVCTL